jgi:hypothetical protein
MFQITRKSIGTAAAATALAASLLAPASYAAEPEVQAQSVGTELQTIELMSAGSYTAPRVLSRESEGWELDAGGPSIYFERVDE